MNAAEHFYLLLKPLFPKNAGLKRIDLKTDELIYRVRWRVPEARRPNMLSRPILVKISLDVLDDFESDPKGQQMRDEFMVATVKALLAKFVDDQIAAPAIGSITPDNTYGLKSPPRHHS